MDVRMSFLGDTVIAIAIDRPANAMATMATTMEKATSATAMVVAAAMATAIERAGSAMEQYLCIQTARPAYLPLPNHKH